ncbi:MAG: glutathione synthase [Gemmatimonadota bacterium]
MRITFVVNDVDTEHPRAATTVMALAADRAGHRVHMIGVRELTCFPDGHVGGVARAAPGGGKRTGRTFLKTVQGPDAPREPITTADLDVLWLRYNPSEEVGDNAWAQDAGILFGQVAMRQGVLVLNHPFSIHHSMNKLNLMHLPEDARPRMLVTRQIEEVRRFHGENGGRIVLKPLMGYGGADVFLVEEDAANLVQLMETLGRDGYVVVQSYLPDASEGDVRLFLVNGRPLEIDGRYAAVHRKGAEGDFRSNISAGGKVSRADVDERCLRLAELVRPRMVSDGLFFVGLDIVGDRLVEVNAISAGGLNAADVLEERDFSGAVIEAVARKVRYRERYGMSIPNRVLATME